MNSPIHVLVVENNPVDVKTVRLVLDALGLEYDLIVVQDADESLSRSNIIGAR